MSEGGGEGATATTRRRESCSTGKACVTSSEREEEGGEKLMLAQCMCERWVMFIKRECSGEEKGLWDGIVARVHFTGVTTRKMEREGKA
jgi:hypothetical protein